MQTVGQTVGYDRLPGFDHDDARAAFAVFRGFAEFQISGRAPLRAAKPAPDALQAAWRAALQCDPGDAAEARAFFVAHFEPRCLGRGFLTGYYEPWVEGALEACDGFDAPLLARPADLVAFAPGEGPPGFDPALAGARRAADGTLTPYPARAEIEAAAVDPIVYLEDAVEAYLIQVQGSGRVQLRDGSWRRLIYDGRNGRPYTSIGRRLIEAGEIGEAEMSLARLKSWLRANGLAPGQRGRELMQINQSFIFFRLGEDVGAGPIGGAGRPLTPLRSLAVDRTLWSYGLPFFPVATLPWRGEKPEPFARLMIAEDTGSAIVGPGRADLFFGGGPEAGAQAGAIRHEAEMFVLWPKGAAA
jgi:membrane-bound lytic murein transglycosylase A